MFIETHAHLYEEDYAEDIAQVIQRAREAGAQKILVPPTNVESTIKATKMCEQFPDICYPMIGLHPEDVKENYELELERLEAMLVADQQSPVHKYIAIGEVGLDYYWDKTFKEQQKQAFSAQISWAARYNLPLMIHARSANGDLLECLNPWRDKLTRGGVFHCFSGSIEMAQQLMNFRPDFYLGIGGVLTFKKSHLPEVVKDIPLTRIVLETDSPYMAPTPMRGKRNEPAFIPYIIEVLAQAKGVTTQEVCETTTRNAETLFFRA